MLKVYEDIFQEMLIKSKQDEVKANLNDVMTEVKKLKHKYSEEHKIWRELQDINSVEVNIKRTKVYILSCWIAVLKKLP